MAPNPKPSLANVEGQVTTYMANLDRDKNGYLNRKEASTPELAGQFDAWDLNRDGQVYPGELKDALENQQAPSWQRVTVASMSQGSDLFSKFDLDRDGQLGVREIAQSAELLAAFDTDGDGAISASERPVTRFRLAIARGDETYKYLRRGLSFKRPTAIAATTAEAPAWFMNMDTNGDGELSPREFLGSREQFQQFDANSDGFLEPSETR
jgi:Ca2+-binding EF-hand superfamily protein